MEKEKILGILERHVNAEGFKKELVDLKTLLNSTECRISQYRVELRDLERSINDEEKLLETKEATILNDANERIKSKIESLDYLENASVTTIENIEEKIEERRRTLKHCRHVFIEELAETKEYCNDRIQELNEKMAVIQNKFYFFKDKQQELAALAKEIETENNTIVEEQKQTDQNLEKITLELTQLDEQLTKEREKADKSIKSTKQERENAKRKFHQEAMDYINVDRKTDTNSFVYFSKTGLDGLVIIKERLFSYKEKHAQVSSLLAETIADRDEIIKKLDLLDEKIATVQREREFVKGKVSETKETLGKKAKETFSTFKSAMETARTVAKEDVEEAATNPEEDQTSFDEFISNLAEKIVEDYATSQTDEATTEEEPTLGSAVNDIFNIFKKRK